MSKIFQTQNQMIIRFPQNIAEAINKYFEETQEGSQPPSLQISLDHARSKQLNTELGLGLKVQVNGQEYKATVLELPTIISSFKTLDRVNFFKSNDISEMILVHQDEDQQIREDQAEAVINPENGKICKFKMHSGITNPTRNIRQSNFRTIPNIDHRLVQQVDRQLQEIRSTITSQNKQQQRIQQTDKQKKRILLKHSPKK